MTQLSTVERAFAYKAKHACDFGEATSAVERSDMHTALIGILDCTEKLLDKASSDNSSAEYIDMNYSHFRMFRLTVEAYLNKHFPLVEE